MKTFDIIDISGDVGIRAYGESLEQVFINAATGMYSLITDLKDIKEEKTISIFVESHSLDGLLVLWLNELIFQFDAYGFIGKKILISEPESLPAFKMKAYVYGDEFDPDRHERKLLIKAATYHKLRIEKIDDNWETDVIFDI